MVSCYFIGYFEQSKVTNFMISWLSRFLSGEMSNSFENFEFVGGDTVRDFVFEDKYVNVLIGVIGINEGFIPDFVQNTTN